MSESADRGASAASSSSSLASSQASSSQTISSQQQQLFAYPSHPTPTRLTYQSVPVGCDNIDNTDSNTTPIDRNQSAYTSNATPVHPNTSSSPSQQFQPLAPPSFHFSAHSRGGHSRTTSANLHIDTDITVTRPSSSTISPLASRLATLDTSREQQHSRSALSPMSSYFNSTIHTSRSYDFGPGYSPALSATGLPSPALSAMIDLTPLPSPIGEFAPRRASSTMTLARTASLRSNGGHDIPSRQNSLSRTSPRKRKVYGSLAPAAMEGQASNSQAVVQNQGATHHGRNRSISDFVPEALHNVRPRVSTFGPEDLISIEGKAIRAQQEKPQMHREEYIAPRRGLAKEADSSSQTLPSPPPSNRSVTESDAEDEDAPPVSEEAGVEYFRISSETPSRKRKWRSLRQLGQGTFSKVFLATSERIPSEMGDIPEEKLDPHKLVAVKICEHGPAGGADKERIKQSLSREIEILKSVSHPSIIHLKALQEVPGRTFLVLTYCTGGDLFELAVQRRDIITPNFVQRIFAELVAAVRYLHKNWIVHRDIKLENVLVNAPAAFLSSSALASPQSNSQPLITLTDLGLSRRIPQPPESPLLTTRCGSEDYAAPELLLGQPYDGRSTDAWALGVLLYALMEGRLPFDAPPGRPDRSRNTHRIARCDWIWCRFGDEDGEWDADKAAKAAAAAPGGEAGWEGGRTVVESLLKKVRMGRKGLEEIEGMEWVRDGVRVEGGLQRKEDDGSILIES